MIFTFGSNSAGRHGKGAALDAVRLHGAIHGQGEGRQGYAYGIPTKDAALATLPLSMIREGVGRFLWYAEMHPELTFQLTPIGCGLAGYKPEQIAPMFKDSPANVILPEEFRRVIFKGK